MNDNIIAQVSLDDDCRHEGGVPAVTAAGLHKLLAFTRTREIPKDFTVEISFDKNYLRDEVIVREAMSDADRQAKLASAFSNATEARHSGTTVCLEVAPDVWDYLMSIRVGHLNTTEAGSPGTFKGMEWLTGFQIVRQAQWPIGDFRIDVVTRKIIG